MLYVDIPSRAELMALAAHREPGCVSIFLRTTPLTQDAQADRIALKNHVGEALGLAEQAGLARRPLTALAEQLHDLVDDDAFWRFQAHSLAVFATPERLRTWRVPNAFEPLVAVSDRFHLKPLLRTIAFPQAAHVLALAAGGVRLLEISADLPVTVRKVEGMPEDAASAVGKASIKDRSHSQRIVGSEGEKVRLRQYARQVDAALRNVLAGSELPLILAASETLGAIFRSVNSYPHLAPLGLVDSPETWTDAQLGERARRVLDALYAQELADWRDRFATRAGQGRATTDVAQAARAAIAGAIDSLLVDIDVMVPGTLDEATGAITLAAEADGRHYGVIDAIAAHVLNTGGRVLGVRRADLPAEQPLAAILRWPS
jgi:hypothetical protein